MDIEQKETIIAECRELMSKGKFSESKTDQFCNTVADILQFAIDNPDEEREAQYKIKKHIDRIEFRVDVSGDRIDPMSDGEGAEKRSFQRKVNALLFNPETSVTSSYTPGWNHLSVRSPSRIANSRLLNEPMVKALLLGIVAGVICRFLPEGPKGIILDGIAAPVMSTVVSLLMGIMGPVFFLFIIVSVSSLGSMEELSKVGKVILRRFILISLWVALVTMAVAFVFFPVFGSGHTKIDLPEIGGVLLDIVPKDFISPFADGNLPQIILFGLVFGTALLMMGDSGKPVRSALLKIKEWVMGVMMIMMKVIVLIPFISTMMMVANGKASIFIQGWKFIAATYVCYALFLILQFIVVSIKCKTSIKDLLKMLKDIMVMAFVTATPPATMQLSYQVSEKEMGIDQSFTDLWLSLSYNLLSPSRTITLVLSVFFIADVTGQSVDVALMIIVLITVVQLTLASSGTIPGATILLNTAKLSTDMVGLFSAFEIFTRNAGAAFDIMYSMLEQLDAARETGKINNHT